jgi:L-alanine-DL-glutamate epimerase-like enolase superfamily enzyme
MRVGRGPVRISDVSVVQVPDAGGTAMLVVVDTDEGIAGLGEVGIRPRQEAVRGALAHLRPLLIGADPMRTEHLWQLMSRGGFFPADGVLGAAVAAVDIALWDIKGRTFGVPVHVLLGGAVRERVPCYTHVGPEDGDTEAVLAACRARIDEGWRHLRFVVPSEGEVLEPRRAARAAVAQMVALRTALGDDVELLLDVHTRLDPPEATMLCRELEPVRPFFVEDPLRSEAPDAYAALRARTGVPIAAGEQYASKWAFRALLDRDLIDYCRADLCIVGGFTEGRKLAGWCEAHHVLMATHNPLGAVSTAAAREFNLACSNFGICELAWVPDAASPFFHGVPEVADGALLVSDRPGLGIELDREAARASSPGPHQIPLLRRADGAFTNW